MAADGAASAVPSSTHRLPTVSATQALKLAQQDEGKHISLGLENLDEKLSSFSIDCSSTPAIGGLVRGQLAEIYGPPGSGKSTLCIQASIAALSAGDRVVWIDGGTIMCAPRLKSMLEQKHNNMNVEISSLGKDMPHDILQRFVHFSAPTMPHLLALLTHPPPSFPPHGTSLVIIDSLSTLFENAFNQGGFDRFAAQKSENTKWMAGRRQAVLGGLASKLAKLAALRNVAVLVTSNITTKIIVGAEASLRASLTGQEWETAFNSRIMLFRDWLPIGITGMDPSSDKGSIHYAEVVKPVVAVGTSNLVAFTIDAVGTHEISLKASSTEIVVVPDELPSLSKKRLYTEIADSDGASADGEFGWLEDDIEELAAEGLVDDSCL